MAEGLMCLQCHAKAEADRAKQKIVLAMSGLQTCWRFCDRSRLDHDHISFNSGISACGRGGAWKQAVHLSAMLQTEDPSRDVVTFNAGAVNLQCFHSRFE